MEFQGRGAGHIHGVAWSDLQKVSELIKEEKKVGIILSGDGEVSDENKKDDEVSHLETAYKSLRENKRLNEDEEKALTDFVDRSVTCTLIPRDCSKDDRCQQNQRGWEKDHRNCESMFSSLPHKSM